MTTRKKILFIAPPLLLFLTFVYFFFQRNNYYYTTPKLSTESKKSVTRIKIKSIVIDAEVARTEEQKSLGLSNRTSLDRNSGMLFDFTNEKNALPYFWMKDMHFDLDFIWIKNNLVIAVDENIPFPKNNTKELPEYRPPSPVDYVLELNSGFVKENKIEVGDLVSFEN